MRSDQMRHRSRLRAARLLAATLVTSALLAAAPAGMAQAAARVDAGEVARAVGEREARAARGVRELVVRGWTNGRPAETRYVRASDGAAPWSISSVGEHGAASLAQQNLARWLAGQPAFLAASARTARYVGTDTAGGRPAHVLEVAEADAGALGGGISARGRYWVDAERGDLLRVRLDGAVARGDGTADSVATVVDLADYRDAGPMRVPFRTVVSLRRGAMLPDSATRQRLLAREQVLVREVYATFGPARRAAESDLRALRALAYDGRLEVVTEVAEVRVNGRRAASSAAAP
jgi:hypothetical protein